MNRMACQRQLKIRVPEDSRYIGYESAQFTFDHGDADARNAPPPVDMNDADAGSRTAKDTPDPITPLVLVADRLDIRL